MPGSKTTEAATLDIGQMFREGQENHENYTAENTRGSSEKKKEFNGGSTHVSAALGTTNLAGEKFSQ
jgi:hypothetical protein